MAIGDDILQPIPAVGTSGTSYASQIVAFLTEVKARLEAKVPLTSVLVSLLDMANNAIENLQYVSLYEQEASPTTPIGSLQNYQGDLWWVADSGAAQITSGNNLNAAALGAIGGDYGGANPASFEFSDADETFYAYDDGGAADWAWLGARGILMFGDEESTTRVKLTAAAGTANMTITFADALPSDQVLVQIDENGDLFYTNTFPSGTDLALAGTGKIKHGVYTVTCPIIRNSDVTSSGLVGYPSPGTSPRAIVDPSTVTYFPLSPGLDSNKTVSGMTVLLEEAPSAAVTYTLVYSNFDAVGGNWVNTGISVSTSSGTPGVFADFAINGKPLYLQIITPAGTGCKPLAVRLSFKSV